MTHRELLQFYYVEERDEDLYTEDEMYAKALEIVNRMIKTQEENNCMLEKYKNSLNKSIDSIKKTINILELV